MKAHNQEKKLGYIDFDLDSNVFGAKLSCIHDCFDMVGNIYGKKFNYEIYTDFPPHIYKYTLLFSVLQSKAVKKHFRFHNVTDEFKLDGNPIKFVLLNQV